MKRSLALAVILASGISLTAAAQSTQSTSAPAAETVSTSRIAVIAFQAAVSQSNEFQRDYADLQKKYDPRRQQLKAESDQIDALTKQLQAQDAALSDAQRASRSGDIDTKKKQLQRDVQDAETDFQQDMQDTFNTVAQKVGLEMNNYARAHGYTVVLDASQQNSPILYAVDEVNITKPVLDAYNVKSGIPAPPPEPAAAPRTGAAAHPAHPATPQK